MEADLKDKIYDRLLGISLKIESKTIPDPSYINRMLGQCHSFIEEVEHFYIQVNKELSLLQRAFNNASAAYDQEINELISSDPIIINLPSVRDREARAHSQLKKEALEIKGYQNEISDLEGLQKTIVTKAKNLSRANTDIKAQLRLLEDQIKLGTPSVNDSAARSLAEEMNKSNRGQDSFEDMETSVEETRTQDPTEPLDLNELLLLNDVEEISEPEAEEETGDFVSEFEKNIDKYPEDDQPLESASNSKSEESPLSEEIIPESPALIDLDEVLGPSPDRLKEEAPSPDILPPPELAQGGPEQEKQQELSMESKPELIPDKPKNPNEIDIDALLGQFK